MRLSRLTSLPGIQRNYRLRGIWLIITLALALLAVSVSSDRPTLAAGQVEAPQIDQRAAQRSAARELLDPLPSDTPTNTPPPTSTPANTATATDIPTWPSLPPSETPTPGGPTATPTTGAQAPESTAPPEPTPRPLYFSSVITGRFFPSQGSCKFLATPATPVVFTQQFPVIAFNPSDGTGIVCVPPSGVNKNTHPFTDVVPGTPGGACTTIATQAGATASDPFYAVFTGLLHVPASGQFVFSIYSDDGWILGMGPRVGGQGEKPSRVTGTFEPGVPPSPEPWPTTVFEQHQIVGRWDDMTWGGPAEMRVTVDFPAAGDYPFELGYTECAGGDLSLVWGSEQGNPIPVGPSPTPTPTETPSPTATNTPSPLPTAPSNTISYYIQRNDQTAAMQLGCVSRRQHEQGVVILDFGHPRKLANNVYGTQFVGQSIQVTTDNIQDMILAFADGYHDPDLCGTGPALARADIIIVAGTTNSARYDTKSSIWRDNEDLTQDHGQAWAHMVDTVYSELNLRGYVPEIGIAGGIDAEYYGSPALDCRAADGHRYRPPCSSLPPVLSNVGIDWTRYTISGADYGTLAWAQGYALVQDVGNHRPLFNYGSCEDCPRTGDPSQWNATQLEVLRRVYHLTWELGTTRPLPQVYFIRIPYEWYNVRWYAQTIQQHDLFISGVVTGCGADKSDLPCASVSRFTRLQPRFDLACHAGPDCTGAWSVYNCSTAQCPFLPPSVGWQALSDMVNSPNTPAGTPNPTLTPQIGLSYSTDIIYQKP